MSRPSIDRLDPQVLLAAGGVVAAVATAGSLYFSLGLGLVPCELCWYQRILMYPLVVVFGVALVERRPGVNRTVLPLSVIGATLAAYHSWLQISSGGRCALGGGCAAVQLRVVGLSIPNLSLLAFVLITAAAVALRIGERD
ncbi:disulfide bond formation protein B [Halosimplex sp. J119]